jgi:putative transposase
MPQRAYQFRCYPTDEQQQQLAQTFGCCRKVYNHFLSYRSDAWDERHERVSEVDTINMLPELKKTDFPYLKDVSSVPLQQALRHLQRGFVNFWEGRAAYPQFKSKHQKQAATYARNGFTFDRRQHRLTVAKVGSIRVKWSQDVPVDPRTVILSKTQSGRYYVSLRCEVDVHPLPPVSQEIGMDVGLTHTATLSTGEKIGNPRHTRKHEKKLARAQRDLSRKQQGSNNRNKARLQVAQVHQKISDCRMDFVHKMTTRLIRENQVIVVEDLHVKGLIQHPKLAKHIADVSWGEIFRQLGYKAEWYGRTFVKIDRFYPSSKRCSGCGYIVDKLPLSLRAWTCPTCEVVHDRDHNAAKNIVAAGQAVLACGGGVRPKRTAVRGRNPRRSKNHLKMKNA